MDWFEEAEERVLKWKQSGADPRAYPHQYTARVIRVLALGKEEAKRLNQNFIGTEHILFGLVRLGQGGASNFLQQLGLNLENIRLEVEKLAGREAGPETAGNIPFTPRAKKVLELAAREARALKHSKIWTGHVLLGLMLEPEGPAAQILQKFIKDIKGTREDIYKALNPNYNQPS